MDRIGIVGQWITGVLVTVGIAIEIKYMADIGFIAITTGSLLFAAVTKLRKI